MATNRRFINRRFFGLNITGGSGMGSATSTDNFTRADANPISNPMSDGSSTWTTTTLGAGTGTVQILSNQLCTPATGNEAFAVVVSPTIGPKQYAQFTVVSQLAGYYNGVVLYRQTNRDCYRLYFDGAATTLTLGKYVAGVATALKSWTVTSAVANDVVRIRTDGAGAFTLSINGVDQGTPLTGETTYTSGQPGVFIYSDTPRMGTFTAGTW